MERHELLSSISCDMMQIWLLGLCCVHNLLILHETSAKIVSCFGNTIFPVTFFDKSLEVTYQQIVVWMT